MINNASNNNTIIEYISADLKANKIDYSLYKNRLWYNGDIINLAVQAFLFGKHFNIKAFAGSDEFS